MKITPFILVVIIVLAFHSEGCTNTILDIVEKTRTIPKDTVSKTFQVKNFNALNAKTALIVEIHKSDEEKAVVTSNIMQFLAIHTKNHTLFITHKGPRDTSFRNLYTKVVIYAKQINDYSISDATQVILKDTFEAEKQDIHISNASSFKGNIRAQYVTLNVHNASRFKGDIQTKNLNAEITSVSYAKVSGKAIKARLNIDGMGKFSGKEFQADTVIGKAEEMGKITINVAKHLNAHATEMAKIRYYEKGNITTQIYSREMGSVHKR